MQKTLTSMLLSLVLLACTATIHAQIYETICWDANCTDVALGPLALIPQCYHAPHGSIRLAINESDSNSLELCIFTANDCPGLFSNTSVESSCHTFVNGEVSNSPFLRGMNNSLYVKFAWDPANVKLLVDLIDLMPAYQHSKRQILNNFFGLAEYGNWCGAGHGGNQDCCNGGKCSNCNYNQGLTTACLQQCPAKDQLDQDCAVHDFCTYNYDYTRVLPAGSRFSCSSLLGAQKADYCACDCQLVRSAQTVSNTNSFYKSAIIFIFTHITDCWYNTSNGPVCNGGDNRILTTQFC
jgi:hypothetical protein